MHIPTELVYIIAENLVPVPHKFKDFVDADKLSWYLLSINPGAIHSLEKNLDKVDWEYLSMNEHPDAVKFVTEEKYLNMFALSENFNPEILPYLIDAVNNEQVWWPGLSANPLLFARNDKFCEYASQILLDI